MSRLIMHVDMDAFFASIEQRVHPKYRGKPVIIGGRNNKYRSIICAASYEAKARGITNAMPSWKALQICPEAIFVPADTAKYVYTSGQIFEILKTFSPQVEKSSIDEFFMDVAGCDTLFGSFENMAKLIKQKIKEQFGITCTIGLAPTKITAKLAAKMKKPDGICILNKEQILDKLQNLPIEKVCGIGERLKQRFHLLSIYTCGELMKCSDELLRQKFGVIGLWLKAACLVEDVSDIDYYHNEDSPPKSIGHSQTLQEVTTYQAYIHDWIYLLSEMVGVRLRRQGLQGRTVHFYISDGFGGGLSKQKTFETATYDGLEIYHRCLHIIDLLGVSELIARVLAVSVSGLSNADNTHLFERDIKREKIMKSIDTINDRFGEWTVYPAALKRATYETNLP
jgi:DNA polymerase-4